MCNAVLAQDALLPNQTPRHLRKTMAPKLRAHTAMKQALQHAPLKQVVLFSSVASLVGAAGQGNYVAANATLDKEAADLVAAGVPATSMQWGAWATAGERRW